MIAAFPKLIPDNTKARYSLMNDVIDRVIASPVDTAKIVGFEISLELKIPWKIRFSLNSMKTPMKAAENGKNSRMCRKCRKRNQIETGRVAALVKRGKMLVMYILGKNVKLLV
jgi:hypothetical protein